jgi:hypothetical protein
MTQSYLSQGTRSLLSFDESDKLDIVDGVGVQRDVHLYVGGLGRHRPGASGKPQGFMVRMPPQDRIRPHFHRIDQWQVFFGAAGAKYLRTSIEEGEVLVQYADAYSTYGPLTSGVAGLDFFTLRAYGDDLSAFMPGSRDLLVHRGQRLLHATIPAVGSDQLPPGTIAVDDVVGPDDDGLACWYLRSGPAGGVTGPDPAAGSGQYYCVVSGAVRCGGAVFGARSLGWIGPDSEGLSLEAVDDVGFQVLVLQFPSPPSFPPPATPQP